MGNEFIAKDDSIVNHSDLILITGSNGFIGTRVVGTLLDYGFTNLRCLVRPSSDLTELNKIIGSSPGGKAQIVEGNLLSPEDCRKITAETKIIYHLAAGRGEKSFPDAYLNSVVTTRNLLKAAAEQTGLRRFVNVSSFSVYSNLNLKRGALLDETCAVESDPVRRGDAYCYAKVKQEEMAVDCCRFYGLPYVILRPGVVYGPGNKGLHGRIGIGTFGIFLHLGGKNRIPLSYVDNCADAIVLGGVRKGIDGEVFNVVDDDLPKSAEFLKLYKKNVSDFRSIYVPYGLFYLFCSLWEKYSQWSEGQLPPVFNRRKCSAAWKGNRYSNRKLKELVGWKPKVAFTEAIKNYVEFQRKVLGETK